MCCVCGICICNSRVRSPPPSTVPLRTFLPTNQAERCPALSCLKLRHCSQQQSMSSHQLWIWIGQMAMAINGKTSQRSILLYRVSPLPLFWFVTEEDLQIIQPPQPHAVYSWLERSSAQRDYNLCYLLFYLWTFRNKLHALTIAFHVISNKYRHKLQ